jgi:predicted MFS family arabinose efflux permease
VIFCSIFLSGLAKSVFDPSLQAYIGQRTPFERRGRIVGIMEVCWAGSTLVGIPLVAICINRFNWYSPFFLMSGLGLIGWLFLFRLLEKDRSSASAHTSPQQSIMNPWKEMLYAWRTLLQKKMNLCVLGSAFCVGASSDNIFVIYGAWLEQSFGLSVISLGLGTTVIGFAELIGEVLTASSGDRLGLGRSAALGLALNVFLCMLLPFFTQTLFFALTGLFLILRTFEFNIVATLCLCTELIPGQRATMMSAFLAMASLGRLIGALAGGPLWLSGGIKATSFVSTVFGALGLVLLLFGLMKYQRIHSS